MECGRGAYRNERPPLLCRLGAGMRNGRKLNDAEVERSDKRFREHDLISLVKPVKKRSHASGNEGARFALQWFTMEHSLDSWQNLAGRLQRYRSIRRQRGPPVLLGSGTLGYDQGGRSTECGATKFGNSRSFPLHVLLLPCISARLGVLCSLCCNSGQVFFMLPGILHLRRCIHYDR